MTCSSFPYTTLPNLAGDRKVRAIASETKILQLCTEHRYIRLCVYSIGFLQFFGI